MKLFAHRGGSVAPENTAAAIKWSFDPVRADVVDGVEIDLRYTKDGTVILQHDASLRRTASPIKPSQTWPPGVPAYAAYERVLDANVRDLDFSLIHDLDVGGYKGDAYSGERLCTFERALSLLPPGKSFLAELKGDDGLVPHLVKLVRRLGVRPEQVTWTCFDLAMLARLRDAPVVILQRTFLD